MGIQTSFASNNKSEKKCIEASKQPKFGKVFNNAVSSFLKFLDIVLCHSITSTLYYK